jgi:hypothetical protein
MAQVIAEVSQSVRNEVKDIFAGSSRESDVTAKDLEDVRAAQRLIDLQAEAAKLMSEGAQLQFLAFGKIKSGAADAIRLLKNHNTLKAIKVLEGVEQIADLCLDVVRRADAAPGRWPAASIYKKKRLVETSDAKNNKLWDASVAEAEADKSKAKVMAGQKRKADGVFGGPRPQFNYQLRGQSRPFRGVLLVWSNRVVDSKFA